MTETTRILGIDPGDKRVGIAVSDPTQTIASPVTILKHVSREDDAQAILDIANEYQVCLIIIGQALNWDGKVSFQGKKSSRLAEEIRAQSTLPVILWDEYGSTARAQKARRLMNLSRKKRKGHHDDHAAAILLQSYLNAKSDLKDS